MTALEFDRLLDTLADRWSWMYDPSQARVHVILGEGAPVSGSHKRSVEQFIRQQGPLGVRLSFEWGDPTPPSVFGWTTLY